MKRKKILYIAVGLLIISITLLLLMFRAISNPYPSTNTYIVAIVTFWTLISCTLSIVSTILFIYYDYNKRIKK